MDTIIVGLDGGEWSVIMDLMDEGRLPNIKSLVAEGVSGELESTIPPVSPLAWNSIHTGTNPGKHGVFDFSKFSDSYEQVPTNASDRKTVTFWEVLNDHSLSTGLFKPPFTYPPDNVEGFLVSGFPTPESATDYIYPPELKNKFDYSDIFADMFLQSRGEYERLSKNFLEVAKIQSQLFMNLLEEYEPDLSMVVYDDLDRAQHFFWRYYDESHPDYQYHNSLSDTIPRYYEIVDRTIGTLVDQYDTNVVVISDHGFQNLTKEVYINDWLAERGYLSYDSSFAPRRLTSRLMRTLWPKLKKTNIGDVLAALLSDRTKNTMKSAENWPIDWSETKAFFGTVSGQGIHVNATSKYHHGTVEESERDIIVSSLLDDLPQLTDPESGEQIVRCAHRREEVYNGENVALAPDIVLEYAEGYMLQNGTADNLVERPEQSGFERTGDHRKHGVFVGNGPAFKEGESVEAKVHDIAPTLLHLLGCPIPESVDGEVLKTALAGTLDDVVYTAEYKDRQDYDYRFSKESTGEIEQRLEDMGYL